MTDDARFQGEIKSGTIPDFLQFLAGHADLHGYLDIQSEGRAGNIWFAGGVVLTAEMGDLRDERAVTDMVALASGTFRFVPSDDLPHRRIYKDVVGILFTCLKSMQEGQRASAEAVAFKRVDGDKSHRAARERHSRRLPLYLAAFLFAEAVVLLFFFGPSGRGGWLARLGEDPATEQARREALRRQIDEATAGGDEDARGGRFEPALAHYREARRLAPDNQALDSLIQRTEAAKETARKAAHRLVQEAEARRRSAELAARVDAIVGEGNAAEREDNLQQALASYTQAMALAPSNRVIAGLADRVQADLRARAVAARTAEEGRREAGERRRRTEELLAKGKGFDEKGEYEQALKAYQAAGSLSPGDAVGVQRIAEVRKKIEQRDRLQGAEEQWTVTVAVASHLIRQLCIDGGRWLDIETTRNGGPIRIGKINPFGVAAKVYFQNPEPGPRGASEFSVEQDVYRLTWDLLNDGDPVHEYVITIAKLRAPPAPATKAKP